MLHWPASAVRRGGRRSGVLTSWRFLARFFAKQAKDARQPARGDDDDAPDRTATVSRSAEAEAQRGGGAKRLAALRPPPITHRPRSNVKGQIAVVGGGCERGNAMRGLRCYDGLTAVRGQSCFVHGGLTCGSQERLSNSYPAHAARSKYTFSPANFCVFGSHGK